MKFEMIDSQGGVPTPRLVQRLRARVGLIVLSTDITPEADLVPRFARSGIVTHVSKVRYDNPITAESLRALESRLAASADLLPESDVLAVIAFCCTSASVELGDDTVAASVASVRRGPMVITAASAAVEALRSAGTSRLSLLTPYPTHVAKKTADYFASQGFRVVRRHDLGIDDDRTIGRLDPAFIAQWASGLDHDSAEAVFIACTAMRAFEVASEIECEVRRRVVTSNSALAWSIERELDRRTL